MSVSIGVPCGTPHEKRCSYHTQVPHGVQRARYLQRALEALNALSRICLETQSQNMCRAFGYVVQWFRTQGAATEPAMWLSRQSNGAVQCRGQEIIPIITVIIKITTIAIIVTVMTTVMFLVLLLLLLSLFP